MLFGRPSHTRLSKCVKCRKIVSAVPLIRSPGGIFNGFSHECVSEENQLPGDDMETLARDHSWTTNGIKSRTLKSRVVGMSSSVGCLVSVHGLLQKHTNPSVTKAGHQLFNHTSLELRSVA